MTKHEYRKNRKSPRGRLAASALACALAVATAGSASAQTTYGALSNFDIFNETGGECNGFEIELEGLTAADVLYTFGAPYSRYGDPVVESYATGVYVRYKAQWDATGGAFLQATPQAPAVITPTDGHACFNGGVGDYLTSGCEHFGIVTNGNPTKTTYRWLIADPVIPGQLLAAGTQVQIPAPVVNVTPPPVPGPDVVQSVIVPLKAESPDQWGEAQWVKVFVTESADPQDIENLVTDDPGVPQDESETETEWVLLQACPVSEEPCEDELASEAQAGDGNESVTRRYEFYAYTGEYDPENHEAIPAAGVVAKGGPLGIGKGAAPDPADVGNYAGAQMVAVNLTPLPPLTLHTLDVTTAGDGTGNVTSSPAGIDCGSTCSASIAENTVVTLTALPDADSFFGIWGGACSGTALSTDVTMSADTSCSATFHLLSASADLVLTTKQPKPVKVGKKLTYKATVQNIGPALAPAPVMAFDLSALGAGQALSIRAPRNCAINGALVTCPLKDLKALRKSSVAVSVKPIAAGVATAIVDATSNAPSADRSRAQLQIDVTVNP